MNSFPQTSIPLLAFAAGDAFGVYYEFLAQTPKEIPQVMMAKTDWPFGGVSDDTLLTILTIKSLEKESPEEAAEYFLAELRRAVPRLRGLGPTTRTALGLEVKEGERGVIGETNGAIDAAKLSVDGSHSRTQEFEDEVKVAGGRLPGSGRVNPENLNSNDEITITDQVAEQLKNWSQKLGI